MVVEAFPPPPTATVRIAWSGNLLMVMRSLALWLLVAQSSSSALAAWKEEDFNPQPAKGDLVLSMPCGGAMVFRRVDVPTASPLDDHRFAAGLSGGKAGAVAGRRLEHIAGAFTDKRKQDIRYYWIGKYEVTENQYQAVMDPTAEGCARLPRGKRLPKVFVNWVDAVVFSEKFSAWLHEKRPDGLPREGDFMAYARLPTEAEWEFAARGGLAVTPDAFSDPLFPGAGENPEQYARHSSAMSTTAGPGNVGLLKPNPLGLHDILGNAAELVLDGFRLNRRGRLHGHSGGTILRGGDYLTSTANLSTASRHELPPYLDERNGGGPNRLATTGFRVVLSVPALPSSAALDRVAADWQSLPLGGGDEQAGREKEMVAAIKEAIEIAYSEPRRAALEAAKERLEAAMVARKEVEAEALQRRLHNATIIWMTIQSKRGEIRVADWALNTFRGNVADIRNAARSDTSIAFNENDWRDKEKILIEKRNSLQLDYDDIASVYRLEISFLADKYGVQTVKEQMARLRTGLESSGNRRLAKNTETVIEHVTKFQDIRNFTFLER